MLINLVTAAASYPVTTAEAKAQLRVDADDEIVLINSLIATATSVVEKMSGRSLVTQTWDLAINRASGGVALLKTPVQSITSISYFDGDNSAQTATVSDFYLFNDEFGAWVEPKPDVDWPSTYNRPDALTIRFVSGQPANAVPVEYKQAILMLVSHWFEMREPVSEKMMREIPFAVSSLINLDKVGWISA